jgi:hypothetical protein
LERAHSRASFGGCARPNESVATVASVAGPEQTKPDFHRVRLSSESTMPVRLNITIDEDVH